METNKMYWTPLHWSETEKELQQAKRRLLILENRRRRNKGMDFFRWSRIGLEMARTRRAIRQLEEHLAERAQRLADVEGYGLSAIGAQLYEEGK